MPPKTVRSRHVTTVSTIGHPDFDLAQNRGFPQVRVLGLLLTLWTAALNMRSNSRQRAAAGTIGCDSRVVEPFAIEKSIVLVLNGYFQRQRTFGKNL